MRPATSTAPLDEPQQHISETPEWLPVNTTLPAVEVAERLEIISELEENWKTNFKDLTDKTTLEEYRPFGNTHIGVDVDRHGHPPPGSQQCRHFTWYIQRYLQA